VTNMPDQTTSQDPGPPMGTAGAGSTNPVIWTVLISSHFPVPSFQAPSFPRKLGVEYTVEWSPHMETIQIVLDKGLLQATDRAARRMKRNRSALVREALREHLKRLEVRSNEERDRQGYEKQAQDRYESALWEAEAAWPSE
jgi:hypothetical protein